jgi:hypothetical protein
MIYPKHSIRSLLTSMLRKANIWYPSDARLWKLPKSTSKKQNIYTILLINMTQWCQIKQRYTFHLHPVFIE